MIDQGENATGIERATLEIQTEGRSPSGALIAAGGRRMEFAGWAELGAVLEEWRHAARSRGALLQSANEGNVS